MLRKIDFKYVDNFRRLIGYKWKSEVQREWIRRVLLEPDDVVGQLPRRIGKTFGTGMIGAAYGSALGDSIVAAPTLTQSAALIFTEIDRGIDKFFSEYVPEIKKLRDLTVYSEWDVGVKVRAVSANDNALKTASRRGGSLPEGYGGHFLPIDEGHRVNPDMLGVFLPMLDDARDEGTAKVMILGVGGHRNSAIEAMKKRGYRTVRIPASECVRIEPKLKARFDKAKSDLSDWEYRMFYECEEQLEGLHSMYASTIPDLIGIPENIRRALRKPRYHFGIDVGRRRDETVVHVWAVWGSGEHVFVNHVDEFVIEPGYLIQDQAQMIFNWIDPRFEWRAEDVVVELNGLGIGLFDNLCGTKFGPRIRGIETTADLKVAFWHWHTRMIRDGHFGMNDLTAKEEFEAMMYNTREDDGKLEFEHSDHWMASCMCWASMSTIHGL